MEHISSPIFQALFQTHSPKIILRGNDPDFTILDYNSAFQRATNNSSDYRGQSFFSVYNPTVLDTDGSNLVLESFRKVIENGMPIELPPLRYSIFQDEGSVKEQLWWRLEIVAVSGEGPQPGYLVLTTSDVTAGIAADLREQQLGEELAASYEELTASNEELNATLEELNSANQRLIDANAGLEGKIAERIRQLADSESSLKSLVMNAHYPLMVLRGRNWIIEIANQQLVNLWDKTIEGVTGQPLMTILPEIKDQPFPNFLRQVYDSGIGYGEEEQVFYYNSPDGPAEKYVSFYYDPLWDDSGEVCGIIVAADDITNKVLQRKELQAALEKEQAMAEEISAVNEELAATVEELTASNEELEQSRQELLEKHSQLGESEQRFRHLIRQAPVGICVIRASDLMIQEVNDMYLELVGKTRDDLENRTIWDAVAEAAESYAPIMNTVIDTATPFAGREHQLNLIRKGIGEKVYFDFVYEPVVVEESVKYIMVVAIEVTDKVLARKAVEEVEQRIRLAVESAEIGTFEFSYLDNSIVTSARFDAIFDVLTPSTRQELLIAFHPDDVHLSTRAHLEARRTGHMFYETRLVHKDGSIHWIRVQAKVFYTVEGVAEKLLGTILDITDFKRLQQQKDDFISIASHELKTPITSLKASLQLLQRQKEKGNLELMPRLIDQAGRSMEKISGLVEDLLNVSRMNAGTIQIRKSDFIINTLLEECCLTVKELGTHDIVLQGDLSAHVYADEDRIDQVLTNFVNNAMKYAPKSPLITINVKHDDAALTVSVIDQGPGIPQDKLPHLFDRYYRADESGHQVSGLGLGLYISAEIIQRHGGTIGVESELGKGSTFWFSLPNAGASVESLPIEDAIIL
jgi:PAS domain S-box-containing protein